MSKHNYANHFNDEVTPEESFKPVVGIVSDCSKLNVRKYPYTYADVRCVLKVGAKVTIDEDGSTDLFYKVTTESGVDGYCMRKYIEI